MDPRKEQARAYPFLEGYYRVETTKPFRTVDYDQQIKTNELQARKLMESNLELFTLSVKFDEWVAEHEIWIEHFKYMERQLQASMQLNDLYKEELRRRDGETRTEKKGKTRTSFKDRPRRKGR